MDIDYIDPRVTINTYMAYIDNKLEINNHTIIYPKIVNIINDQTQKY